MIYRTWIAAWVGALLVVAAIVSNLLPPSPEYSPTAIFRERLEACILGLPLVIVLDHLWFEARFRESVKNALNATCTDACA